MEKSFVHWRAEHPIVRIFLFLCLGIVFSKLFVITISSKLILCALLLNIPLLILIAKSKQLIFIQISLVTSLVGWGILLNNLPPIVSFEKLNESPIIGAGAVFINWARSVFVIKIDLLITQPESNQFAKALLFGIKGEMNETVYAAFKNLGLIHIIAISGMHIEIIASYLKFITSWFPEKRFFRFLNFAFLFTGIWCYTFIAFASPSIIRASIYFSVVLIGRYYHLIPYRFNSIAFSLLLFLLAGIYRFNSIGMQLSYAAVIGIHLLYPIINKLASMENIALKFLWNNLSITLAAQLATLPILLYHFHQLSSLSLLSNFIIIPLSNVLLYGLLLMLICPMFLQNYLQLGQLLSNYIEYLQKIVLGINSQFPGANGTLNMRIMDCLFYYACLVVICIWLSLKKTIFLLIAISLITLLLIIKLFNIG
jgi:competence protein ComEC